MLYRLVALLRRRQLADRGVLVSVDDVCKEFDLDPDALSALTSRVADSVDLERSLAGPSSLRLTDSGMSQAASWGAAASDVQERRSACRSAIIDWLYIQATPPASVTSEFPLDVRASAWGVDFTVKEILGACQWLVEAGLVRSLAVAEYQDLHPELTHVGQVVVEVFHSDVTEWVRAGSGGNGNSGAAITVHATNANIASQSPGASQRITVGEANLRRQLHELAQATKDLVDKVTDDAILRGQILLAADEVAASVEANDHGRRRAAVESLREFGLLVASVPAGAALLALIHQAVQALP